MKDIISDSLKVALIAGKYFNAWESLACGYLSSYIKKWIPNIELIFFHGNFDSLEDIVDGAKDCNVVLFSCTSPSIKWCLKVSERIKSLNPKTLVIFGGYGPTAGPLNCLGTAGADCVLQGYGESPEIIQLILGRLAATGRAIKGNPEKLDNIPCPDRDLIKVERHIQVAYKDTGKRITSFRSHRGCPYRCVFCSDGQNVLGNHIDFRDSVALISEIAHVSQYYKLDYFKFCDPTWNINKNWVKQFCQEKILRLPVLPYFANIHAKIYDSEMFELMKNSGCTQIGVGIESGSDKILSSIGKATTKNSIRNCVKSAQDAGIDVRGYFILGLPDDSNETLQETEDFAEELDLSEYGFSILAPYPGTALYSDKYKDIDWSDVDEYSNDIWQTKYLSNDELKQWQERLVNKFNKKITFHNKILQDGTISDNN